MGRGNHSQLKHCRNRADLSQDGQKRDLWLEEEAGSGRRDPLKWELKKRLGWKKDEVKE